MSNWRLENHAGPRLAGPRTHRCVSRYLSEASARSRLRRVASRICAGFDFAQLASLSRWGAIEPGAVELQVFEKRQGGFVSAFYEEISGVELEG